MSTEPQQASDQIGSLNEKPLHASLKKWYAGPTDQFEVSVDGYVIDIVRDDLLVEIQTKNFSAIKRKLFGLTVHHKVRLMYPIAQKKLTSIWHKFNTRLRCLCAQQRSMKMCFFKDWG